MSEGVKYYQPGPADVWMDDYFDYLMTATGVFELAYPDALHTQIRDFGIECFIKGMSPEEAAEQRVAVGDLPVAFDDDEYGDEDFIDMPPEGTA